MEWCCRPWSDVADHVMVLADHGNSYRSRSVVIAGHGESVNCVRSSLATFPLSLVHSMYYVGIALLPVHLHFRPAWCIMYLVHLIIQAVTLNNRTGD